MEQKLLVVALGTTGGEVGLAFRQQVARRTATARNFYYKMLCLDTSDQLRRSGKVAPSEFVHLATEENYMSTIVANSEKAAPRLHEMLYPGFTPPPSTANGAGNIRYSAAALLALPSLQESIRGNLRALIGQLADMGETKSRDISFAIVISAVGATGSGSLSLLIPLVLETAQNATITKPNIDIVILHPVLDVSDRLLLANAEALYIELAAHDPDQDSYTGRKLILGSGHTITRLDELERTAATLIRLTTDARYGITEPYWSTLPNRGILREQEAQTMLPTHLSSATPVTIGLANLSKQVVEVDTARLVKRLIEGTSGQDETNQHVNTLLSHLSWLQGSDGESSYRLLLDDLTVALRGRLDSYSLSGASLTKFSNNVQKADLIRGQYLRDLDVIEQEKPKIRPQALDRFKKLKEELNKERISYVKGNIPLTQLLKDYQEVLNRINVMQAAANGMKVDPPWSEDQLQHLWHDVATRGKLQAINSAISAIQQNLTSKCEAAAMQIAVAFLNSLRNECLDVTQHIQAFIHEASERFKNKAGWDANVVALQVQNDHPLYISALASREDLAQYYDHVGIFARRDMQHDLFSEGDGALSDPLAHFRHELEKQDLTKHFFDGNYNRIFTVIEQHVEDRVRKQLDNYPLMKVFESMRPALRNCLSQALDHAKPLMPFSGGFASGSVEKCFVTACWSTEEQHNVLQEALSQISQDATLIKSDDPTEIVVFYLVDGLAIAAIMELTGRCLKNFLDQRSQWTRHNSNPASRSGKRGIPVYSGYNLEMQVRQQGIVHRLFNARQHSVGDYTPEQVPELADPDDLNQLLHEAGEFNGSAPGLTNNQSGNMNQHNQPGGESTQAVQKQNPSGSN